nr:MAG TPA: hypothetical protein [Ackermannviridae sp.]
MLDNIFIINYFLFDKDIYIKETQKPKFQLNNYIGRDCRLHGWRGSKSQPIGKPFFCEARSTKFLVACSSH